MKKRPKWSSDRTAAENAQFVLPELAESFLQSGGKVAKARSSAKSLHQFRLDVKRFRYYLELFRPCYGPGLKLRIDQLRRMQDHLGMLNDCDVTKAMLRDAAIQGQAQRTLLEFLDKQAEQEKAAFIRFWQETCQTPNQVKWWTGYLKRFAGNLRSPKGRSRLKASGSTRKRKASSGKARTSKNRPKAAKSTDSPADTSG